MGDSCSQNQTGNQINFLLLKHIASKVGNAMIFFLILFDPQKAMRRQSGFGRALQKGGE